ALRRRQPAHGADRGGGRVRGGGGRQGSSQVRRLRHAQGRDRGRRPRRGVRLRQYGASARAGGGGQERPGPPLPAQPAAPPRHRLCALARGGLALTPASVLERMLDPSVKLGTSTPRADPSGDYAWEVFRKADRLRPGAFAALEKKALQLTGGPDSATAPPGRALYGMLVADGRAALFLTYCTNAREAQAQNPAQQVVALPDALAVGADYGLTVLADAPPAAYQFAVFILSSDGQRILAKHGFAAPAL